MALSLGRFFNRSEQNEVKQEMPSNIVTIPTYVAQDAIQKASFPLINKSNENLNSMIESEGTMVGHHFLDAKIKERHKIDAELKLVKLQLDETDDELRDVVRRLDTATAETSADDNKQIDKFKVPEGHYAVKTRGVIFLIAAFICLAGEYALTYSALRNIFGNLNDWLVYLLTAAATCPVIVFDLILWRLVEKSWREHNNTISKVWMILGLLSTAFVIIVTTYYLSVTREDATKKTNLMDEMSVIKKDIRSSEGEERQKHQNELNARQAEMATLDKDLSNIIRPAFIWLAVMILFAGAWLFTVSLHDLEPDYFFSTLILRKKAREDRKQTDARKGTYKSLDEERSQLLAKRNNLREKQVKLDADYAAAAEMVEKLHDYYASVARQHQNQLMIIRDEHLKDTWRHYPESRMVNDVLGGKLKPHELTRENL